MIESTDNVTLEPVAGRAPLILGRQDFASITEAVAAPVEQPTPLAWWFFFLPSLGLLGILGISVAWLVWEGIGVWGLNQPVGWAFDITNFVFWIGIGHAGTLISAVLFLFRQKWRTSINRAAEAMTIFAVMCALLFPGIHVGRPWVAYWMAPLPNQMGVWPRLPEPAAVGLLRGLDLRHRVGALLVRRADPRPRHPARPRQDPGPPLRLRLLRARLARLGAQLAALRDGVPDPRRHRDAARAVGALDRLVGLRGRPAARLAHHDLPALLRRRRDLLGLRDGGHA